MSVEQISSYTIQWEIAGHRLFYNQRDLDDEKIRLFLRYYIHKRLYRLEAGEWSLRGSL